MVTEEAKSLCAILPLQCTHSTGHGQGNAWCGTQVQAGWKYWVTTFWCGQVKSLHSYPLGHESLRDGGTEGVALYLLAYKNDKGGTNGLRRHLGSVRSKILVKSFCSTFRYYLIKFVQS
jgi:hypothetical protein